MGQGDILNFFELHQNGRFTSHDIERELNGLNLSRSSVVNSLRKLRNQGLINSSFNNKQYIYWYKKTIKRKTKQVGIDCEEKRMKKHCNTCGENIKNKPIIYDNYYYCSKECVKGNLKQ